MSKHPKSKSKTKSKIDGTVLTLAVVGSLVLVNVLGLAFFGRLDWTRDRQFTLSDATVTTLRGLQEPLTVRAYFSQDLPPPHSTHVRYVKDLLDAYYTQSRGKLRYEFIDPVAAETEDDKEKKKDVRQDIFGRQLREATAMERELQGLGIPPVQVRVNEDDKVEVKRAYMGIAVQLGERKEVIPVVSETAGLEYDLTTLVRKVAREATPKVALVTGHGGLDPAQDLGRAQAMLGELYAVSQVNLAEEEIAEDVAAVLVIGPQTSFTEAEKRKLDAYLVSGHSAAFLLGPVRPDLQTLQSTDNAPGLEAMLASYGVVLDPGLVLDAECATISVATQAGFMRVNQPVRYPFMPVPKSLEQHPLTRGLAQVAFPFMGPLHLTVPADAPVRGEILVRSSADSWVQPAPFNLDPLQRWSPPEGQPMRSQALVASLAGPLTPFYPQATPASESSPDGAPPAAKPEARLLVANGAQFVADPFFGKTNETFLLNAVDWLVRDDGLLAVRSRGLAAAPLDDLSDARRNTIKYANIMGLPLSFIGLGLVRWRRREARRAQATIA